MAKVVLEFIFKGHKRCQEFFFGLKKGDNGFSIKDCDSSRIYDAIYNTYTNNLSIYYQDTDIKVCDAIHIKINKNK